MIAATPELVLVCPHCGKAVPSENRIVPAHSGAGNFKHLPCDGIGLTATRLLSRSAPGRTRKGKLQ